MSGEIHPAGEYDLTRFSLSLKRALSVQSGVGITAATWLSAETVTQLAKWQMVDPAWVACFEAYRSSVAANDSKTLSQDRAGGLSVGNLRLSSYLLPLPTILNEEERRGAQLIRSVLLLTAVAREKTYPVKAFKSLSSLILGDSIAKREILRLFSKEQSDWQKLLADQSIDGQYEELVNTIFNNLAILHVFPTRFIQTQIAPTTREEKLANKGVRVRKGTYERRPDEETGPPPNLSPSDLVGHRLQRLKFAEAKQFSGVETLWRYQLEHELTALFTHLIPKFTDTDKVAIAIGCTFFTSVCPRDYEHLWLSPREDVSIWLDLVRGGFCWDLRVVANGSTHSLSLASENDPWSVFVPLPAELVDGMRTLLASRPQARNFLDLFEVTEEVLSQRIRRTLRDLSQTSHRCTSTRLSSSFGRILLTEGRDEALAAMLSADMTIGSTSQTHYFVLTPTQANDLLRQTYSRLGFSGHFNEICVEKRLHQIFVDEVSMVWESVKSRLAEIRGTFERLPPNLGLSSAIQLHNKVAHTVALLLFCSTAHRPAQELSFQLHAICVTRGSGLISDKATSPYHQFREVPLPPIVCGWISFYLRWLRKLITFFVQEKGDIAGRIASIVMSNGKPAAAPLFFKIEDGRLKPFGAGELIGGVK